MTDKTTKTETKKDVKIEREYVIPLREKCRVVPRYKKANKAIKIIKTIKHPTCPTTLASKADALICSWFCFTIISTLLRVCELSHKRLL